MVIFKLIEKTDDKIIYHYWPEAKTDHDYGVICIDIALNDIKVIKLAEDDWERVITKEELNEMRDRINEDRLANGEEVLTEEELPIATEEVLNVYYGNHAISKIWEAYKEGIILDEGKCCWY